MGKVTCSCGCEFDWPVHRVACGDCTDGDVVETCLCGDKAEMMFTDPPYGVGYEGGHLNKRTGRKLDGDSSPDMYASFLPVILPHIDGPCYVWFADIYCGIVCGVIDGLGCDVHAMLIWNKTNATYAAMNANYKRRYEPCMYFKPKGSTLRWVGDSDECNVWDIKRDPVNDLHPTQKPVELAARAIGNHGSAAVCDPFLGSGTTILAASNNNRRGIGIEMLPKYVAVTLERLTTALEVEAVRL